MVEALAVDRWIRWISMDCIGFQYILIDLEKLQSTIVEALAVDRRILDGFRCILIDFDQLWSSIVEAPAVDR